MKSSGSAIHLYSSCLILVVWKYQYREWSLCCNILLVGKDRFLFVYNPCNSPTWQPAGKVGTMEKRGHIRPQALAWVPPHPTLPIPSKPFLSHQNLSSVQLPDPSAAKVAPLSAPIGALYVTMCQHLSTLNLLLFHQHQSWWRPPISQKKLINKNWRTLNMQWMRVEVQVQALVQVPMKAQVQVLE